MTLLRDALRSYHDFCHGDAGVSVAGPPLLDRHNKPWGRIERLTYFAGGLRVEGWVDATTVLLADGTGAELAIARPYLARAESAGREASPRGVTAQRRQRMSGGGAFGFNLKARSAARHFELIAIRQGASVTVRLPAVSWAARLLHRLQLDASYMAMLARHFPDILRWMRKRDPDLRHRLGAAFRNSGDDGPQLDLSRLSQPQWPEIGAHPVTIVMPVYQGLHLIDPVLERVSAHTDLPWHLVVIDDASPDAAVHSKLSDWAERLGAGRMTLLRNESNLGFVGSANRGLEQALRRGHDVVLLNSDASVGPGWASRLLQPMVADRGIASVTPMSNEAEIATAPVISRGVALGPGEEEVIDRVAAGLAGRGAIAVAPTGIGFCMAMNIDMLQRIPAFDTAFGRGYGEEVDWCQRAVALGGRHVINAGVFVGHAGGASFGSEAKRKLIRENGRRISRRYPHYDREVQSFIAADPLRMHRILLGLSFATSRAGNRGQRLSVFLGHTLGGGAEICLENRVRQAVDVAGSAVIIRPLPGGLWKFTLETETGTLAALLAGPDEMLRLFAQTEGMHIVYSCAVGAPEPLAIPRFLTRLATMTGSAVEVTFNDFFPISPSYTLIGRSGLFGGLPLDPTDAAHRFTDGEGQVVSLADWQHEWGRLIEMAGQLTVFSQSSARIVAEVWPGCTDRIKLRPHALHISVPTLARKRGASQLTIGVLGNINTAKGAKVLSDLSCELARNGNGRLVLIGNLQPGYSLKRPSLVTGSYDLVTLPALVAKYGISRWFFPSIWPETFSYATHEMLATGLPVWCFDLGAQADAVRRAMASGQGGGVFAVLRHRYETAAIAARLTAPLLDETWPTEP